MATEREMVDGLPLIVEIAAEVCYKMGGIHTILKSKAANMQKVYNDRYLLVGPYVAMDYEGIFTEIATDQQPEWIQILGDKMADIGIQIHFGKWHIPGEPRVLLIDPFVMIHDFEKWKETYGLTFSMVFPVLKSVNMYLNFGAQVSRLLQNMLSCDHPGSHIIAHFHEYNASYAIPWLKHIQLNLSTVFTTHATVLGRHLAFNNTGFYQVLPEINIPDLLKSVKKKDPVVWINSQMESLIARSCDVFTVVSEITGKECQFLLGRAPDVITPNGFDSDHLKDSLIRKEQNRQSIISAVQSRINQPVINSENTFLLFSAGRFEYYNKGFDVFIRALARINDALKRDKSEINVIAFIIIDAPSLSYFPLVKQLAKTYRWVKNGLLKALKLRGFDPVTHRSVEIPEYDPVLIDMKKYGLKNLPGDRIKLFFHPDFVTKDSPFFKMDYPDFIAGCDLGVFPSYYEPWGYTPVECNALDLPAISTDTSGFARYIKSQLSSTEQAGLAIIEREHVEKEKSVDDLTDILNSFISSNRKSLRITHNLKPTYHWDNFIAYYIQAYQMAIDKQTEPM